LLPSELWTDTARNSQRDPLRQQGFRTFNAIPSQLGGERPGNNTWHFDARRRRAGRRCAALICSRQTQSEVYARLAERTQEAMPFQTVPSASRCRRRRDRDGGPSLSLIAFHRSGFFCQSPPTPPQGPPSGDVVCFPVGNPMQHTNQCVRPHARAW
jgi:hypothetical protein